MEEIRINKYIAECGICSRRKAEEYILNGKVKLNGKIVSELGQKVNEKDRVELNGKCIYRKKENIYIMLNKPKGYVTTSKEQFGRPSVLDLVKGNERVFPVGRLDMDSRGLIILTNDGEYTNNIIHPTKHIKKTYKVKLKNTILDADIKKLEQGVDIGDYITKPATVKRLNKDEIEITITEGKNRQVRKMCEAIGNKVIELKRISIGNLKLGALKEGKCIVLNKKQAFSVFDNK